MANVEVSVVIPVLNEVENIATLCSRLNQALEPNCQDYELIFVGDGCEDGTEEAVLDQRLRDPRVKLLSLSRRFGHQQALTAGIDFATGLAVITMDGDLQHPPELLPRLLEEWRNGNEVVTTRKLATEDLSLLKRTASRVFYRALNRMSNLNLPEGCADFRLLDRQAVEALRELPERTRFLRGMVDWIGFQQSSVAYEVPPRIAGTSKYSFGGLFRLASLALSFSSTPLYLVTFSGFIMAGLSFLYGLYAVVGKLLANIPIRGWPSLAAGIMFLGGVQLISVGIVGAYIARIFDETKGRPIYIVRREFGFEDRGESELSGLRGSSKTSDVPSISRALDL
jgi:glycosyltransferase involved in cell wall biosynthesis